MGPDEVRLPDLHATQQKVKPQCRDKDVVEK